MSFKLSDPLKKFQIPKEKLVVKAVVTFPSKCLAFLFF
jgi:hypothetical protein